MAISVNMAFRYESQRRAKDARWTKKWAAIESRYRKPKEAPMQSDLIKSTSKEEPAHQSSSEKPTDMSFLSNLKETAIKINSEPTIIELAGVISPDKESAPVTSEFIFRMPSSGEEVGRAKNIDELVKLILECPLTSIIYHANRGHFAKWLEIIGYEKLAEQVKKIKGDTEEVRSRLIQTLIQK